MNNNQSIRKNSKTLELTVDEINFVSGGDGNELLRGFGYGFVAGGGTLVVAGLVVRFSGNGQSNPQDNREREPILGSPSPKTCCNHRFFGNLMLVVGAVITAFGVTSLMINSYYENEKRL